jgi:hypothetical protein
MSRKRVARVDNFVVSDELKEALRVWNTSRELSGSDRDALLRIPSLRPSAVPVTFWREHIYTLKELMSLQTQDDGFFETGRVETLHLAKDTNWSPTTDAARHSSQHELTLRRSNVGSAVWLDRETWVTPFAAVMFRWDCTDLRDLEHIVVDTRLVPEHKRTLATVDDVILRRDISIDVSVETIRHLWDTDDNTTVDRIVLATPNAQRAFHGYLASSEEDSSVDDDDAGSVSSTGNSDVADMEEESVHESVYDEEEEQEDSAYDSSDKYGRPIHVDEYVDDIDRSSEGVEETGFLEYEPSVIG